MDFADYGFKMEKMHQTLLACNLHQNVTCDLLFELFYQVGPIDRVKLAVDENGLCNSFAMVIFKDSYAVRDSFKLLCGTKLYGLPIVIKYCSKDIDDPVFHYHLDYFKHGFQLLANDDSNRIKRIDQSSYSNSILYGSAVCDVRRVDTYQINDWNSNVVSNHGRKDDSSRRQLKSHNFALENDYYSVYKSDRRRRHNRKSKHNNSSSSTKVINFYHILSQRNNNNDPKHKNTHLSSTLPENPKYTNQGQYGCRSIIMKRRSDKKKLSRHQPYSNSHDSTSKNKHNSVDKSSHYNEHYTESKYNNSSSSTVVSNMYRDFYKQNNDPKHKNTHLSSTLHENPEYTNQGKYDCRSIITKRCNDKKKLSRHQPYLLR